MVCTGAAAVVTLVALFSSSYFKYGTSLASSRISLWYNIPAIVCWAVACMLLTIPRSRRIGAGLTAGVTFVWFAAYLPDVGAVVNGSRQAATGFDLRMAGIALALIGATAAIRFETRLGGRPSATRAAPVWAVLVGAVGVAWGIGTTMNWMHYRAHATAHGYTYRSTGTATITHECCTLLNNHGWSLTSQLLFIVLAVLIPVLAVVWRPRGFGVAALIGAAVALVASPLSTVIRLGRPAAANMGVTPAEVTQGGLQLSQHGLPGLWIALVATAVLAVLAVGRAFQTGPSAHAA
jgi:hypothetical protein